MIDLLQSIGIIALAVACIANTWLIRESRKDHHDGGAS